MNIIFQGQLSAEHLELQFKDVLNVLKNEYHIDHYREIHLTLTLVDHQGLEVELVDSQNKTVYRYLEVRAETTELGVEVAPKSRACPLLRLVVDNTRSHP